MELQWGVIITQLVERIVPLQRGVAVNGDEPERKFRRPFIAVIQPSAINPGCRCSAHKRRPIPAP